MQWKRVTCTRNVTRFFLRRRYIFIKQVYKKIIDTIYKKAENKHKKEAIILKKEKKEVE